MPVVGLVVCALPVMSLGALLGGMDPQAVAMAFLIALAVAILGCVLALAISVWATRTHEVIMAVYAFWTLVLLFIRSGGCSPVRAPASAGRRGGR